MFGHINMSRYAIILILVFTSTNASVRHSDLIEELTRTSFVQNITEDAFLDVPDLISKYGYPVEEHEVVTSDGYILRAHRIPHGRKARGPGPAVLIMHGLMGSSADFLLQGPEHALGYILADSGYDVWLGNARGNTYSRRHLILDPDDRQNLNFWKFSWDEMGNHDLPALVDYILEKTGEKKLHYIGYSQGGTAFLVLTSLRPQYNEKFISFQGLAPRAHNEHNESELKGIMVQLEHILEATAYALGHAEIMRAREIYAQLGVRWCSDNAALQPLCLLGLVAGFRLNINYFNATLLPVVMGHMPAGAAIRQVIHFGQNLRFHRFARYDHRDPLLNFIAYGTFTPPEYDLSRITTPVYLHYGYNDAQNNYKDVLKLGERLRNTVGTYKVGRPSFGHFDFILASDAKEQLYDLLIKLMREAEQK